MWEFPSLINSIVSMLSSNSTWALYKNFITNSTVSLLTAFHYQDRHNRERVVEFIGSSLHCLSSSCWELLFYVGDMVSKIHTYLLLTLLRFSLWSCVYVSHSRHVWFPGHSLPCYIGKLYTSDHSQMWDISDWGTTCQTHGDKALSK